MLAKYIEQCRYAILILTTLNAGIVKISIVLFYRRLFPVQSFKIASRFLIGFLVLWTITFVSAMAAQCTPPHYAWDLFEFEYSLKCMNVLAMYQGMAYSDLILDVVVLAFPIPMVVSLRLPWNKKIKVIDTLLLSSV